MSYHYEGDRYRDPFIPLNGIAAMTTPDDRTPQISESLDLKGILQDEHGRVAVLSSGVSSYILRAGRLYDGRNRPMKGISGVIKAQSVVLVGSDHTVKESSPSTNPPIDRASLAGAVIPEYKSSHSGFIFRINRTFHSLFQSFSDFYRLIADSMVS